VEPFFLVRPAGRGASWGTDLDLIDAARSRRVSGQLISASSRSRPFAHWPTGWNPMRTLRFSGLSRSPLRGSGRAVAFQLRARCGAGQTRLLPACCVKLWRFRTGGKDAVLGEIDSYMPASGEHRLREAQPSGQSASAGFTITRAPVRAVVFGGEQRRIWRSRRQRSAQDGCRYSRLRSMA